MKIKLSHRMIISIIMSMVLFCLPMIALALNNDNKMGVQAQATETEIENEGENQNTEENIVEDNTTNEENTEDEKAGQATEPAEEEITKEETTEFETETDGETEIESETEDISPNVRITINTPSGWYNSSAKVTVSVSDIANSGKFEVAKIQAKISQNGSWTDITEDGYIEISENCSVYVQVSDQNGNTYEKNRNIKCFDYTKPSLNASVSDGLLSIIGSDTDSGVKAVYVNGYEFTELTNGTLNIRLQQFDSGYQYFTIQAMDNAGNMSDVYKTANPYYTDPESDSSDNESVEQLPVSAEATKPTSATATVTEHVSTDSNGNEIKSETNNSETNSTDGKTTEAKSTETKAADTTSQNTDTTTTENESSSTGTTDSNSDKGREFYTIQTASEKVFYLIINRDGDDETVYFLTEISENDLLNVTTDNSETLPKNSAAIDSAIPVSSSAINVTEDSETEETETEVETETCEDEAQEEPQKTDNPIFAYIIIGIAGLAVIGGVYFMKKKKKKEDFVDDDEDEEDDEYDDEYESDDEPADSDEEFLNSSEEE
jgi:LPXTG-motif cell wall-anchored protein